MRSAAPTAAWKALPTAELTVVWMAKQKVALLAANLVGSSVETSVLMPAVPLAAQTVDNWVAMREQQMVELTGLTSVDE
jgi:hypothetical protein